VNGKHAIAIWAGATALFANLAAINVVRILGDANEITWELLASAVTAAVVAAGVYSKQRWDEAREQQKRRQRRAPD
jgi:hypothetical protein